MSQDNTNAKKPRVLIVVDDDGAGDAYANVYADGEVEICIQNRGIYLHDVPERNDPTDMGRYPDNKDIPAYFRDLEAEQYGFPVVFVGNEVRVSTNCPEAAWQDDEGDANDNQSGSDLK